MSANELLNNPFEWQRWEEDAEHIIYLPKIFTEFEKRQDLYIVGSRGTGKTTFLKALNWKTRVENHSIHAQIENENLFKDKYIGIYINAMSFGDSVFESSDTKDDSLMRVYSLWAEMNVLYRLIEAIKGLYEKDYIDFTIKDEISQCNKIYDYLSNRFGNTILKDRKSTGTEYDITLLKQIVGELRNKVVDEKEKLMSNCDSYSFGSLIEETVPKLVCLCDEENNIKWCTKICFDSIESAPKFHKIINTFVAKKLSERVWFIISGLTHRLIDMTETYVPHHNLTYDDKTYIDLDKRFFSSDAARHKDFYPLVEGICDLRLKHFDTNIDKNDKFDLTTHLGSWKMNQILDVYLKSKETISVSNEFKKFMNLVEVNYKKNEYSTNFPPYIETYYYDILKSPKQWNGQLQKSRQKNSDAVKKYIVIMLALLRNYKLKNSTPYVGRRQIMSLCGSIRDFLKLMAALFDIRIKQHPSEDISYFFYFKAKLSQNEIKAQTGAAIKVAEKKYGTIEDKYSNKINVKRIGDFIDMCGKTIYDVQAKKELSSLMSEEKAIFTVSFKNDADGVKLHSFLKTAADDTYIKILDTNNKNNVIMIVFELARLFAPKYKYSFRSTRNKIKIDDVALKNICIIERNSFDAKKDNKTKSYQKKLF
jgi:nucleoside-triphosphatase THEP1